VPRLSLTDFVDVVSSSGTPKATKVRQIKNRPDYNPAFDFWKKLRDGIVSTHEQGLPKTNLDQVLVGLTDKKKQTAYPVVVKAYKQWWGRKTLVWLPPPHGLYAKHGIEISVNPEIGLSVNGRPHLIKLYFKERALTKNRVDLITHLMAVQLGKSVQSGTVMSVLDVRRAKLISPTVHVANLTATVDAELAYIAALWAAT